MKVVVEGCGSIVANKDLMNLISLTFSKAAEMYRLEGCDALARQADKISIGIYKDLDSKGYYGA